MLQLQFHITKTCKKKKIQFDKHHSEYDLSGAAKRHRVKEIKYEI